MITDTELREIAETVASSAARIIKARAGDPELRVETKSSETDPVTEVDRLAEQLIVDALRTQRPDDGFLGEEGASEPGSSGIRWVIDPIDGTVNFIYGIPGYSVSIAAERNGIIVAGCVIDPARNEIFSATRGEGATCNGQPISCGTETNLARALVSTGFAYDAEERTRQGKVIGQLVSSVRDIRRFGAAATDLCWVGAGRVDAYFERNLKAWDWAAGALIAAEAGAQVGAFADRALPDDLPDAVVMAANPVLFAELHRSLESAGEVSAVLDSN